MKTKKTVLIFGISSFVGSNIAESLKSDYRIVGTFYETPAVLKDVVTVECDVHNKDLVQKVVYLFKPDIVIYAIGLTRLEDCQEFPKVADALNTAGVFNVSMASERYGAKFIYFSSCYIFSGENVVFRENDTPMPTSIYGNTVASTEFYVQKSCLNYLIFRCCPLFGKTYNVNSLNWMEVLERYAYTDKKIICDTKVKTGYLDIWTICDLLKVAIEADFTNRLFQVTSRDTTDRYSFSKQFMQTFGFNDGLVSKGDWDFPRTENQFGLQNLGEELYFAMDYTNLEEAFNIKLPTIEESIERARNHLSKNQRSKKGKNKSAGISFI
jgi:dTDP-4-dehydrorhamnose reductase